MLRILILSLLCVFANAHSLKIFAKQEGNMVSVKTFFYGNSPCKECEIALIKNGEVVKTLKTDEKGTASFEVIADEFEIQVDGGLGHGKSINFKTSKSENSQENSQILEQKSEEKAQNSSNLDENSAKKENSTQNQTNLIKENSSSNSPNSSDLQDDGAGEILKFALSFLAIFIFFGVLYLIKKR